MFGIVASVGLVTVAIVRGLSSVVTSTTPTAVPPGAVVANWLGQIPYVGRLTCVRSEVPARGTQYWIVGDVDPDRFDAAIASGGVKFEWMFGLGLRTALLRDFGVDPAPFTLPPDELCQYASVQVGGGSFYEVIADPKTHRIAVFVKRP